MFSERTQLRASVRESPLCRKLANHRVVCGGRTRFSNESTTPSQQHETHPGHQDSRDRGHRGRRSRLSLHCGHGWSDNVMSLVDYSSQLRRKGKSVPIGPNPAEKATHELTHTSFRNWCSYCVRARAADDPHHRQPHKRVLSTCKALQGRGKPASEVGKLEE